MPSHCPGQWGPSAVGSSRTASAAAAGLHQQLRSLHASVSVITALARPQQQRQQRQHTHVVCALPFRQQQQQRRRSAQQQRSPLLQQRRQLDQSQTQKQQEQTLQDQQSQQQQQQKQQQRQQHKQRFVWGYMRGGSADEWTWDDDYNQEAIAKAAAEARQLPPTPRQARATAAAAVAAQQRPTVINRLPEQFDRQILSNAVLLVDKPARWSSADVVRQLKAALKVDKVCFGAPLDTEATGLLIILLGAASRLTPKLEPLERTYSGTFRLGVSTTTYDASGQTLESNPWQHISDGDIAAAAAAFTGEVQQVPCMWSSSKYKNKPLRWYAERGEVVAREPKSVHISSIQFWRAQPPQPPAATAAAAAGSSGSSDAGDTVCFRVVAGKGASVRVLVHDLGKALGCGAHVTSLRREGIGGFVVDTAWSLDVLLPLARKYAKGFRQVRQY